MSASFFIDMTIKASVVLLAAWIATLLMRRASAAARHAIWTLGIASLLLVPALSAVLPAWRALPQWSKVPVDTAPAMQSVPESIQPIVDVAPAIDTQVDQTIAQPAMVFEPPAVIASPESSAQTAVPWVALVWSAGVLLAMLPVLGGTWILRRLSKKSTPLTNGTWEELLDGCKRELNFSRRTKLLVSTKPAMPMTWGIARPKVLLPADAEIWPMDRRRAVLLHELAHVKRHDCLWQLLIHVSCAVYWFNPLVWLARAAAIREREKACDDLVLACGTTDTEYAEQILQVASGFPAIRLTAATGIPMARVSQLEGRLLAILDRTRNRKAITWSGIALAALLLCAVVLPVTALRAKDGDDRNKSDVPTSILEADVVLNDPDDNTESSFIDLEAGHAIDSPIPWPEKSATFDFRMGFLTAIQDTFERKVREKKLDVLSDASGESLTLLDMVTVPIEDDAYEKTPVTKLVQNPGLDAAPPDKLGTTLHPGKVPATYLFKTREGNRGVLQIVSFSNNPVSARLRYKLVKPPGEKTADAADADIATTRPATTRSTTRPTTKPAATNRREVDPGRVKRSPTGSIDVPLPVGGAMRLVAILDPTESPARWWKPDGSAFTPPADWKMYEANRNGQLQAFIDLALPGSTDGAAALGPTGIRFGYPSFQIISLDKLAFAKHGELFVGAGTGAWRTLGQMKEGERLRVGDVEARFESSEPFGLSRTVHGWYTPFAGLQLEWVAFTNAGTEQVVAPTAFAGGGLVGPDSFIRSGHVGEARQQLLGIVSTLDLKNRHVEVTHMELRARERTWVRFSGLAAVPDQTTQPTGELLPPAPDGISRRTPRLDPVATSTPDVDKPFTVKLPNGIGVELLAVRPKGDKRVGWFAPDGLGPIPVPYKKPTFMTTGYREQEQLTFRITGVPEDWIATRPDQHPQSLGDFLISMETENQGSGGGSPWAEPDASNGGKRTPYYVMSADFHARTADARLYISGGPWEHLGEIEIKDGHKFPSADLTPATGPQLHVEAIKGDDRQTKVFVNGVKLQWGYQVRLNAFDVTGKPLERLSGPTSATERIEGDSIGEWTFDAPVKSLGRLRVDRRPVYAAQFKDIPMKPKN